MEIEDHWNLTIPDDDAADHDSLKCLSRYVAEALGQRGEIPDADLILTEMLGFASRHFAPVPVSPEFDPFALYRVVLAESRAKAPYFHKLETNRRRKLFVRKLGFGTAKFLAAAVYLALFVTGVRLMIDQNTRLAALGCVMFLLAFQLPYIVMWVKWYRGEIRNMSARSAAFPNRRSTIANRK